ncbi:MAG: SUMF1/EgtB/PvdO family nonheme iron enzyme [Paludibacteraceae bacterium]|nr:SUMF1/EgtB/PvdO family nonheme iron enzyme [Paludibacteraceae bacterium]
MKRFQISIAAALLASASAYAANQYSGTFGCKAKYTGKNTYLMDSCYVDYTIKRVVGIPSYTAKVTWTKQKNGYNVGGVAVNPADIASYKHPTRRYNDVAPTKATFNFTVLFYSNQLNCVVGSAQSSMVVNNLEKAGVNYGPVVLNMSNWNEMFKNVVIGKQDAAKAGVVVNDANVAKWLGDLNIAAGKADPSTREGRRALSRLFSSADRVEIVNPTVSLDWDIDEYVFINNTVKMIDNISDAMANEDTVAAVKSYFIDNPATPIIVPQFDYFWNTTVAPYSLANDAYDAAEAAYKKGDYNTAAINYQKVLDLDPSVYYCKHRLAKIEEYNKSKESRNFGEIDMVLVEGNSQIKNFYISKKEITNGEWRRVMGAEAGVAFNVETRNQPVSNITWEQALTFVKKLNEQTEQNFRLVKANEWEYAANGGKKASKSDFAGSNNIVDVAWSVYNAEDAKHDVAKLDANELGIYDMTGNVAEWVADVYDKKTRITKGGSYADDAAHSTNSSRQLLDVNYKSNTVGFRIAQDE